MIVTISVLLFVLTTAAIAMLWRVNRKEKRQAGLSEAEATVIIDPGCCGAHEVCDFDAAKADPSIIEYFDDEELDQLRAVNPANFSTQQIDQLRDVLYTLQKHEIRKWLLSLERRSIHLPGFLMQEARDLQIG